MRFFFQTDEDKFIYSKIKDDVTLVRYVPLYFGIGLALKICLGARFAW